MLRFILYFILFFILFRLLKSMIGIFLKNKRNTTIKNESQKTKSKFEDVEDAKYIEIKPEDEKKNWCKMSVKSISSNALNLILKKILAVSENSDKNLGDVKKILIIRQHNQLGDMLAGVSLFRAVKEKFPHSHLTLLSSKDNYYGVVKNKLIDDLIVFDKTKMFNPFELIGFIKRIRQGFDLTIVPVTVSISFTSNILARLSKSKIRIGPKSLDGKPNDSAYFFDRRVDIDWRKYPDSNVSNTY